MTGFRWIPCLLAAGGLLSAGCGGESPGKTAKTRSEEHEEVQTGVSFEADHGLTLSPGILEALGVQTEAANERPLIAETKLLAHVFATSPQVLASVSVPAADSDRLDQQSFANAKLVRLDRSGPAGGRVDAVFALERGSGPQIGEFVELTLTRAPRVVLTVPSGAILDAASGTFVYIVNGTHYLRTAVKIGARSPEFVEIIDGLQRGAVVVSTPVKQLWLLELRLTKAGGHSH